MSVGLELELGQAFVRSCHYWLASCWYAPQHWVLAGVLHVMSLSSLQPLLAAHEGRQGVHDAVGVPSVLKVCQAAPDDGLQCFPLIKM